MMNKTYVIENLDCSNCALKVEKTLRMNKDIHSANINLIKKKIHIQSHKDIDINRLNKLIRKVEPDVYMMEENDHKDDLAKGFSFKYVFWILGLITLLTGLGFQYLGNISPITYFILMLVSYLFISYRIIYKAIKNISQGYVFDEHVLMTIATIGAFILGEYIEGIAVMVFYQIGEHFQDMAVNRSKKSIEALLNTKPQLVHIVQDEGFSDAGPNDIMINDLLLVKPGEIVPTDAVYVKGETAFDFSSITGESLPVDSKKDLLLPAGVINLLGPVYVKALCVFKDSTLQKTIDFIESNHEKKAKAEKFMTKFAKVYTPIVVGFAMILAFIGPLITSLSQNSTYISLLPEFAERALIFLVISCPCALVLSIPLSFYAGIGVSSKHHILVKSGSDLETFHKIDHFVFDKTGTLTEGKFKVVEIVGKDKKQIQKIAFMLESHSTHPIGKSIVSYIQDRDHTDDLSQVKEIFGKGLTGLYDGKEVAVGNKRLLDQLRIDYEPQINSGLSVFVCYDGGVIGTIILEDQIKEKTQTLVERLKSMGKDITMVTGDSKDVAEQVAKQLGIDHVYAEVSPEDKAVIVEKIKEKQSVAFIGDGVNDAMVLTSADLGISMGILGSDIAIEASDAVIMNDHPVQLLDAIRISRKTHINVYQNICLALGFKILVIILGAFGIVSIWMAIFADVGVSLIAVLNAIRLLRYQKIDVMNIQK